jgi:D-xylose transport system ATP-binding protein
VQAVSDRIVVLRLGRNAAEFVTSQTSTSELVAAITGASDNVVTARAEKTAQQGAQRKETTDE